MEFSIKFDTAKSGWSNVYFRGQRLYILENNIFLPLKIDLVLAFCGISASSTLFVKVPILIEEGVTVDLYICDAN